MVSVVGGEEQPGGAHQLLGVEAAQLGWIGAGARPGREHVEIMELAIG